MARPAVLPLLVLSSADAAAALVVPALLLLLPCHQQPPRREANSQTSFSKLTRNSKTQPNFVPKMAQNRSKKLPNVSSEILENPRES